eukprot:m.362177 g.362177  ORF g.362177 m.362177 type:complete len:74 (+) comp20785_c0_seq48:516-737(+)
MPALGVMPCAVGYTHQTQVCASDWCGVVPVRATRARRWAMDSTSNAYTADNPPTTAPTQKYSCAAAHINSLPV